MTGPLSLSLAFYRFNSVYRKLSDVVIGKVFEPEKDIVLVTGGSTGLGKELVKLFVLRKASKIIVLDVNIPLREEDKVDNVIYYRCDISEREDVLRVCEKIIEDVGVVTILINNAGITKGKLLLELSFEDIEKTIKVNLLSNFYTIKAFLPGMLEINSGYIITVASVLGYISPARLSAYGASKSGLIALHESLTYELGPPSLTPHGVKTLLVCPGQLKTKMFAGVSTPSSVFAPELDPSYVANSILRAIELGRRGEMKLPFYGNIIPMMRSLPWPLAEMLRGASGVDSSMKRFVGKVTPRVGSKVGSKVGSTANSIIG